MKSFDNSILPFLGGIDIRYQDDGVAKAMSVDYFRNNFKDVAAPELPNTGQKSFYYQSIESPDLVMRFRISDIAGLTATLIHYSEYEKQLKATRIC